MSFEIIPFLIGVPIGLAVMLAVDWWQARKIRRRNAQDARDNPKGMAGWVEQRRRDLGIKP